MSLLYTYIPGSLNLKHRLCLHFNGTIKSQTKSKWLMYSTKDSYSLLNWSISLITESWAGSTKQYVCLSLSAFVVIVVFQQGQIVRLGFSLKSLFSRIIVQSLFLSLFVSLSVCLSVSVSVCLCLSVSVSLCLCLCLCLSLPPPLSLSLSAGRIIDRQKSLVFAREFHVFHFLSDKFVFIPKQS